MARGVVRGVVNVAHVIVYEVVPMEEVEEESYEERQRDELEFLQFVFVNDFEDLREKDTWKV